MYCTIWFERFSLPPWQTVLCGWVQLGKNVILLNKVGSGAGSTVIHSTEADPRVHPVQLIQAKGDNGDIIVGGDSDTKKRREILARRPSYRKILNDLSEPGLTAELKEDTTSNEASSQESDSGAIIVGGQYHGGLLKVVPALQLGSQDGTIQSLTGGGGGTLVQYAQSQEGGQQFFVPVEWAMRARCVAVTVAELSGCQIRTAGGGGNSATSSPLLTSPGGGSAIPEETSRKREIRLLKNREAAKECRRKKKEYIKCLENRVAVLENQNKALIDELKSLKELYCRKE
ncbi:CREB1 [Cordylochernes scorpioides]|uniref:CREB1 n=1 Tax=Cordylochernes scorpioides TaxID=51811 RepID=A0ABY6LFH5_9ARAC|nr:CREB1 [Cordylochernes scorpioides]